MNTPDEDKAFEKSAKAAFDDSVERLDAATLSKLNQGRQAALAEMASASPSWRWSRWVPATGMATAALVAVVVLRGPAPVDPLDSANATVTDFEILISDDALDMIEELEFYSWIDVAEFESTDNAG
jgi:hypothetical protein